MKNFRAIHLRRFSQIAFLFIFVALFLSAKDPFPTTIPPDLIMRIDPFAGLVVMIASRSWIAEFWPAVIILIAGFLLARSFCGWVCPLGTILDIWNRISKPGQRRGNSRWKYAILIGMLLLAVLSIQTSWVLDPLVIFTRTMALSLYPLCVWGLFAVLDAGVNLPVTEDMAFNLWNALQGWLLPLNAIQTGLLLTTLLLFIAILLMEKFGRRTWCRVICPLGALFGLIAHIAPFGRKVDPETCTSCELCGDNCRMGAIDEEDFYKTKRSECILCMECALVCPEKGQNFNWNYQAGGQEKLDLGRRRVFSAVGSSLLFGAIWRTQLHDRNIDNYLIRPPGAVEEQHFLDLCLRCEECIKICSSTGGCLQPSGFEYGIAGFWTPKALMREGYCEYSCTLCGQVCPSGAIKSLSEEVKKKRIIGLAYIDQFRCIPWEGGEDCIVCEEHCPTPIKAIQFESREGEPTKLPYVDRTICIGCGICETKCPVMGESAIRIFQEGEQREVIKVEYPEEP
ncbi:hypothetical protein CEE37_04095 [candidate division LCP-89 bacterium B3_LCP]|uniref:4Fe-4S ferredoxin-type domain-containing protein n=1 Tax=candidate division LCP-89 bacterium B3_LCP TaxID=2012998 RepID=A0A532V3N3_UNCL8|nr:MAG: hypothetical protein CEE37_04095 [candidate division LCP-89 bacterium B3_LCP]